MQKKQAAVVTSYTNDISFTYLSVSFKIVRRLLIYIATFLSLTFSIKCNTSIQTERAAGQTALNLANNIDRNSLTLLKEYNYGRRGDHDFWQRISADTTLYTCSYKTNHDTVELTVFVPLNFVNDFASSFSFDTSRYHQYTFFQRNDTIVKIIQVDNLGQDHISGTSILTKDLFPNKDPFLKFAELTELKDKFGFIGTSYRSDIGDFIIFWITPQYKLTYLPDTSNMSPKSKKYWLDDFSKGKKIKEHWRLLKVYE